MILGQPIFPGESGVDQLVEIIKVLGTPTRFVFNILRLLQIFFNNIIRVLLIEYKFASDN